MKTLKIILVVACLGAFCGCIQQLDPVTGEQTTTLAPEAIIAIDAAAEAAAPIAALLTLFFPALYPVIGVAAGAAGAWAKMRPKVTTAREDAEMYHTVSASLIEAIEEYKADNPKEWAKLRAKLGDNVGDNTEAVIRAIRGLPLKD